MDWPFGTLSRANSSRCRLLELPPEIRNAIYELALSSDKSVVTFRLDNYQRDIYDHAVQPPLTRVSRQVRRESLPIYFAGNSFALHTEGSKGDDARRWLLANEPHLTKLLSVSLWVRYVSLTNDPASSRGALSISLHRFADDSYWQVEGDWKWITVTRKPAGLERDAEFLMQRLRVLLAHDSTICVSAHGFASMMTVLRTLYVKEKMFTTPS